MNTLKEYIKTGAFFKAVVEVGSDIIFIVDYDGEIVYHNAAVIETLGYRKFGLIGKNFFDYINPITLPAFKKAYQQSTKKRFNESVEFQFLRKDKTYQYLEFNSINLYQTEKIKGLILDCRDIAQRKKDAEELLRAQKAKEQFLANISHEIRTPINGIAGMAVLLSQNPNSNDHDTYVNAIKSAADNLKVIINDILDLASIESGKLKFEQIGFNMNDLLESLIRTFSFQAQEKRISLAYSLKKDANQIYIGDPVRLNQILINLLGNALKFTHQGSITINCWVKKKETNKNTVAFEVSDTGIGIPKDKLGTIFESFSQADASVTRKYGGTGLGLTIVRQLVELQKGKIAVKSEEGKGSSFTFYIPYELGNKENIKGSLQKESPLLKKGLDFFSVLLVEDNDINRLYASSILKIWDCKIDMAENGFVAVEKIKNENYDIVLMDIQMPVMDGFEATKAIRSSKSPMSEVPIIALTANATQKDVDQCLSSGMNDCITKPFTPEDLYSVLIKYLKPASNNVALPSSENLKPGIDLTYLKSISDGNEKFIEEMIEAFLVSIPKSIHEMRMHIQNSNYPELGRALHKIKPSLTLMGLPELRDTINIIEEKIKAHRHLSEVKHRSLEICDQLDITLIGLKSMQGVAKA